MANRDEHHRDKQRRSNFWRSKRGIEETTSLGGVQGGHVFCGIGLSSLFYGVQTQGSLQTLKGMFRPRAREGRRKRKTVRTCRKNGLAGGIELRGESAGKAGFLGEESFRFESGRSHSRSYNSLMNAQLE